jgi:DNA polymerase IIIc chi subunit
MRKSKGVTPETTVDTRESPPKAAYPITLDLLPRSLPVKLTDAEIITRCRELAAVIGEIEDEEAKQHTAKEEMKAWLAKLDDKKRLLSHIVTKGEENRPVDIKIIVNENDIVTEVRQDTGEVIITRQAKDTERQLALIKFKEIQDKAAGENVKTA